MITPPIFASIVFYLFARGISAYFYPVLPCGSLEVQPRSYRHGLWTHSHKYLHFRIPFIVRFGDETFIPRLPTSRGLYTTDICGLAGVEGFEPSNAGVKVLCLTTWLHPNISQFGYLTR